MLADELKNPHAVYFVAETEDGRVAGYIGMHTVIDEGYITNVATAPEFRGQGIASTLIDQVIGACKKERPGLYHAGGQGVKPRRAGALPQIRLQKGGVRANYYQKPVEDALIMFRTIE